MRHGKYDKNAIITTEQLLKIKTKKTKPIGKYYELDNVHKEPTTNLKANLLNLFLEKQSRTKSGNDTESQKNNIKKS